MSRLRGPHRRSGRWSNHTLDENNVAVVIKALGTDPALLITGRLPDRFALMEIEIYQASFELDCLGER